MRNLLIGMFAICSMGCIQAQDLSPIQLNSPTPKGGLTVMGIIRSGIIRLTLGS